MGLLFGVIADDFTGACDVGVQFEKCGLETVVLAGIEYLDGLEGFFDVVVVNTETRNVAVEVAYRKVREALRSLRKSGVDLVYKKIDSTLRGNIGAELDAVMDELGVKAIVVAPAFPAHSRTVVNGCLLVDNAPLESTEFAQDPLNPLDNSDVTALIGRQTKRRTSRINLSKVRKGVEPLSREIRRLIEKGTRIIVADAETEADLAMIAGASVAAGVLPCGSAGLAENVSSLLPSRSRLLVVSGSVNSVTLGQIASAERELDMTVLEPNLSGVLTSEEQFETAIKNLTDEAEEALVESKDVAVRLAKSRDLIIGFQEQGKKLGMNRLQVAERLLSVLSESFTKIAESHRFAGLILIGGDTAVRIMNAIGACGIRIEKEVLPGIPIGRILGGEHDGLRVITKAGGFGGSQSLVKIMKAMQESG